MFELAHLKIVKWPVTLAQPGENGEFVDVTVYVDFERLTRTELAQLQADERAQVIESLASTLRKASAAGGTADLSADAAAAETALVAADAKRLGVLQEKVKGWGEQIADRGTPVPFTPATLSALLDVKPVFTAFWRGLLDASENVRPKTSPPSQPGTPAEART